MDDVAVVDSRDYKPHLRIQRYVQCLFESGGNKRKAAEASGYNERGFFRHMQNMRFVKWYSSQVDIYIRAKFAKAAQTLDNAMDGENKVAAVNAAKVIFQLAGKLQINGSANIEREPAERPITLIKQEISISREQFSEMIEHCETIGIEKETIEEAKRLRDAEFETKAGGDSPSPQIEDVEGWSRD